MLSKEVLGLLRQSATALGAVKYLPFWWDKSKAELRSDRNSSRGRVAYAGIVLLEFGILVPLFTFGIKACVNNANNFGEIVMGVMELICLFIIVAFQFSFCTYRHETVVFINKFLQFEESRGKLFRCMRVSEEMGNSKEVYN
jgi:hypothetical protein